MLNMLRNFLTIIFISLLFSCEQKHPLAEKLCNCYTQLHRAQQEQEQLFWSDSCNVLYIKILKELESQESEQLKFQKAYRRCQ
tara:strand:+ start:1063 stop:1311 length:249 start_codon:yes stop_codon:yes gene_type:complete